MLVCLDRKVVSLFECGEHVIRAIPPHSRNLTAPKKDVAKQTARAGMKLARIRTAMLLYFGLRPSELPALQKVKNVVCSYRRTKLGCSDTTTTIVAAVQRLAFNGGEDEHEHEPFTFGWDLDREGNIVVSNSSDEKLFLVCFSTKALLCQASRDPKTFIFHVDATYKTNQNVPLVGSVVISQQQGRLYAKTFAALRWIYNKDLGEPHSVAYVMGDDDMAQCNAVAADFGSDCKYDHLMCYYHLIAKVIDRLKGLPYDLRNSVLRDIYDLHYSRSADDFTTD
ncbi:hypothetical protein PC118_g19643 [Phytophthora cactorum]|uniref:MULE transposase domain-containing protein n=1 Tax=Phytophthora cactorum TaxID=29920 RepID=A0A8T1BF06_9STRA|nr:hypothetical protein PC117_g21687 [Phytophthora cactorum]KAG2965595.1 hypothetical protein PC118_g19643 [Phytophthora cactorum]KAG3054881.1 hypothetical protein PC122_g21881 [Phytophthora cactorum]KAG3128909.1 hypothetical protein C6341_g24369 [Phytophthora cactorum]